MTKEVLDMSLPYESLVKQVAPVIYKEAQRMPRLRSMIQSVRGCPQLLAKNMSDASEGYTLGSIRPWAAWSANHSLPNQALNSSMRAVKRPQPRRFLYSSFQWACGLKLFDFRDVVFSTRP